MRFVLAFDRKSAHLEWKAFSSSAEALARRFELEEKHAGEDVEIVVISAPSIDVVRRTHPRYFRGAPRKSAVVRSLNDESVRRSIEASEAEVKRYA